MQQTESGPPLSVLIVDTIYLIAMDLQLILTDLFNCSAEIATPEIAEQFLADRRYDVVILDTGEDPEEAGRRALEIEAMGSRVVFMTAHDLSGLEGPGFAGKAVIMKPFSRDHIAATLFALDGKG